VCCSSGQFIGSHSVNWRLITAPVAEVQVAYHVQVQCRVYIHHRNNNVSLLAHHSSFPLYRFARPTYLSSAHVVLNAVDSTLLSPELKEADDDEDLPLGCLWDGVPLGLGGEIGGGEGVTGGGHGPRPVDVGLDAVSYECKHGNAAVLDLGVAEEPDGGLVGITPELGISERERIVELDDGVGLLSKGLKVGLGLGHGDGRASRRSSRGLEGGSSGEKS